MGQAQEKVPTMQEELERKTIEAIEDLLMGHENGRITEAQLDTGMTAIWTTVSGLVGRDMMDLISEAKPKSDPSSKVTALLHHPEKGMLAVRWHVKEARIEIVANGQVVSQKGHFEPVSGMHKIARGWFMDTLKGLLGKGFRLV